MDAWRLAEQAIGGPMHPGGDDATRELLGLAGVGEGTRLVDLGCGTGRAIAVAETLGAEAVGLDRDGPVLGDLSSLPFADDAFEVAISECALCLAEDLDAALMEARRVLGSDGRLAVSEVVAEDRLDLPAPLAGILCLDRARPPDGLRSAVEAAGFEVAAVLDRSGDLATLRDRVRDRVDVEGLLSALGEDGRYRDAVRRVESAVEDGAIGYVHLLATT